MIGTVVDCRLSPNRDLRALAADLGSSPHERRVTTIALRLFDLLTGLHGLGKSYRKVLEHAAMVHDVGRRRFGATDHNMTGARLVWEDESLDLSAWERRCVAYLVRYHSGGVPPASQSEYLRPDDRRRKVKRLLGFLRAADGLDSRHICASTLIIKCKARRVQIQSWVAGSIAMARDAFQRRRKFTLLEKSLSIDISVHVGRLVCERA